MVIVGAFSQVFVFNIEPRSFLVDNVCIESEVRERFVLRFQRMTGQEGEMPHTFADWGVRQKLILKVRKSRSSGNLIAASGPSAVSPSGYRFLAAPGE